MISTYRIFSVSLCYDGRRRTVTHHITSLCLAAFITFLTMILMALSCHVFLYILTRIIIRFQMQNVVCAI